jgi:hypothetical protein
MSLGIALLLMGSSADISAALQSIELAKRTTGVVHAVFVESGWVDKGASPGEEMERQGPTSAKRLMALVNGLGDLEEVAIYSHLLESLADELLIRFVCEYRIHCLILGVENQEEVKQRSAWVEKIRRRLARERNCFLPHLWSVIIRPWERAVFEQIVNVRPETNNFVRGQGTRGVEKAERTLGT